MRQTTQPNTKRVKKANRHLPNNAINYTVRANDFQLCLFAPLFFRPFAPWKTRDISLNKNPPSNPQLVFIVVCILVVVGSGLSRPLNKRGTCNKRGRVGSGSGRK